MSGANNYIYPEITTGLGELSPAMWSRMMASLRHYESYTQNMPAELSNENLYNRIRDLENAKPYFFAKLLRAHVLDESLYNPNVYEYAWCEVYPETGNPECCAVCLETRDRLTSSCCLNNCGGSDPSVQLQGFWQWRENLNHTSWGEYMTSDIGFQSDNSYLDPLADPCLNVVCPIHNVEPYTAKAVNMLESFNTGYNTAPGTDETFGVGDFMLQAIGGGDTVLDHAIVGLCDDDTTPSGPPCTQYEFPLKTTPIVLMFMTRQSDGTLCYTFQASNSYDGTCVTC